MLQTHQWNKTILMEILFVNYFQICAVNYK